VYKATVAGCVVTLAYGRRANFTASRAHEDAIRTSEVDRLSSQMARTLKWNKRVRAT
jgi:hypothetical protein